MWCRLLIGIFVCWLLGVADGFAGPLSERVCERTLPCDTVSHGSIVFLPDSLIRDSLKYEYKKIKSFAYRWKWGRELYKMVFVNPNKINIDIVETQNSEDRYQAYRGKRIRNIHVWVLPPFGSSIQDTVLIRDSLSWFLGVANSLHQSSSEKMLKKQMTLRPGMEIDPFEIVQNELLLKELDIVDDALIEVRDVEGSADEVDLLVICKDEFSWTGEVQSNFLNSFDVGIETQNLFRLGHTARYEISYRGSRHQKWGNEVEYTVNNLWGSYFDFQGLYHNTYREDLWRLEAGRRFLTYKTPWAGGVALSRVYSSSTLVDRDITKLVDLFNYRLVDAWVGRAFRLPEKFSYYQNIYLTGRFTATQFVDRPEVSSDTNHYYYDRHSVIGALTYRKLKYYKANLIYDFGRTEDIPSGLSGVLIFGYEKSDFSRYAYLGTEWHYSWFDNENQSYYAFYAALGSYWNGNTSESGVAKAGANYISRLYNLSRHRMRFYANLDYIHGFRRNPDDYIYFDDNAIRGFDSDTLRGTQRLGASVSATLFLPYIKRGFRASVSAFVDAGVLAPAHKFVFQSQTYWGVGFSLNLRNDNLIFKNISLRVGFYPNVPPDAHLIEFDMSSERRDGFHDFRVTKPEPVSYE